jgi:hypothetical protein
MLCRAVLWSALQLLGLTLLFSLLPVQLLTTSLAVNWSLDCKVRDTGGRGGRGGQLAAGSLKALSYED